ncbi:YkgJ family cysteine cluster protein [Puniceibacterium confluentis]|uniref:YkgJ family cysteine cluster protein n=1 Tax=Puniceibacterium confluentis TaxID=1958944 RepID=UPI0011B74AEF|nr:YkgJ family cysteine cluster protein [Puniceibacterium confluentis]
MKRTAARPNDHSSLRARISSVRLRGGETALTERARKLLLVYLDTAAAHAVPFDELVRTLRSGVPALRIAGSDLQQLATRPGGPLESAACAAGCAFCCILSGRDGGVIAEAEARQLHAALAPVVGAPDGRDWHPRACAALDPLTRTCRAYDARPLICRTYISQSREACAQIASGTPAAGTGVLAAQGLMLAVQSLARAALEGVSQVPTYSMARITSGATAGEDIATSLRAARQPPRTLDDERRRFGS